MKILSFYPCKSDVHYTVEEYKLVSEPIYKKIIENENNRN
jgi:hypothetical protein|tara:strand:- start:330 stop:449 length:120 start_codon:yes stop_codon:yes gene_type:complete